MKIAIGSMNQTKISAVQQACPFLTAQWVTLNVSSQVSDQPFSEEETWTGAINRATAAKREGKAAIGIGLEGGVVRTPIGLLVCNWGALVTEANDVIVASGAKIQLPHSIERALEQGMELADAMAQFTQRADIRSNEGAIGIFTNGALDRTAMFRDICRSLFGQREFRLEQREVTFPTISAKMTK